MALYEATLILRPDLAVSDVERISDEFSNIVTENEGKLVNKQIWGLKDLAYKVKKNKKGQFVHYNLEAGNTAINELKRKIKISEDVIRDLIVKVDTFNDNAIKLDD